MTNIFGASGVYPTPRGQPSIAFDLVPGSARIIPTGTWMIDTGSYTTIQEYDPVQGQWLTPGGDGGGFSGGPQYINSDGFNYRVINLCGCIVGATVTTAGSGYTASTPPTVTFTNAASAAATAIVGGAVNTTVTVTNGGSGYLWAPVVFLDSPPIGAGYQATASCTISSAAVNAVTINNQGAGYTNVPNIYFVNDPRDTVGSGAQAVATLTGSGTVTQLLITNHGTANTTLQPTIAFSSGSAAAFPIMVRAVGGITLSNVGSGYSGNVLVQAWGNGYTGSANAITNPKWTTGLVRVRPATLLAGVDAGTKITSAGTSLFDGGIFAGSAPTVVVVGTTQGTVATVSIVAVPALTWTNPTETITIQPV